MFGGSIVWYLFLGGGAATAVALLSLGDILYRANIRTASAHVYLAWTVDLRARDFSRGFAMAFVTLAAGVLCLISDLGRPERFYFVFMFPTPSVLTFGSVMLSLTLLCALFLWTLSTFNLDRTPLWAIKTAEICGVVAGTSTAVYTGVLFAQIEAVALWNPVLPFLFATSSFSVGTAGILCCMLPLRDRPERLVSAVSRADLFFILCETITFLGFGAWSLVFGGPATEVMHAFLFEADPCALWGGFFTCGLVAPFVLAILQTRLRNPVFAAASIPFILIGGYFLRYCIVNAPLI